MSLLVQGTVRVHMLLADHSQHAHVALNTGIPCNIHTHTHTYTHTHTHNVCSRIVHVLHTRLVAFGGKQCWFLLMNKRTFTVWMLSVEIGPILVFLTFWGSFSKYAPYYYTCSIWYTRNLWFYHFNFLLFTFIAFARHPDPWEWYCCCCLQVNCIRLGVKMGYIIVLQAYGIAKTNIC